MPTRLLRKGACGYRSTPGGERESCGRNGGGELPHASISPPLAHGVPPITHEVLRSPGQPLDPVTRAFMEPRFGRDFSQVRVHTDAQAAESARTVDALAYTVGHDVVFGTGQYAPGTDKGRQLVAHELAHVLQQQGDGTGSVIHRSAAASTASGRPSRPSDPVTQMSKLLEVARENAAGQAKRCYRAVKSYIRLAGGYGDILDIQSDERFQGYRFSALQFALAVAAHGASNLGLQTVSGNPMDAEPGTILVLKGHADLGISTADGDISVIGNMEGSSLLCYNDGRMLLGGPKSRWEGNGKYADLIAGMYKPVVRPALSAPTTVPPSSQPAAETSAEAGQGGFLPRRGATDILHTASSASLAPNLPISSPEDSAELEAEHAGNAVTESGAAYQAKGWSWQRNAMRRTAPAYGAIPPLVHETLHSSGLPLDSATRAFMEPRFGHDFSQVRVHTGAKAADSASAVNALAYTVGRDVVFGAGQYAPTGRDGQRLIAHELTHVVQQRFTPISGSMLPVDADTVAEQEALQTQQMPYSAVLTPSGAYQQNFTVAQAVTPQVQRSGSPRYSHEERLAQHEGRVTGTQEDIALANQFAFQPGDIVFRLGSGALARISDNPVTHGGVYLGHGLIHDMVGFGNRTVRTSLFYQEAADPSVVKVVRFTGPLNALIIQRLLGNIRRRDFRLPSDPRPWNLFSSADDYQTATCLEYSHAQFLYAIRQLRVDPSVSQSDRDLIRRTYFSGGGTEPDALIRPQQITVTGDPNVSAPSSGNPFSYPLRQRGPSAMTIVAGLVAAADYLADDVDPNVFQNRFEGSYQIHQPEGWLGWLMGPTHDTATLRTFTYRSFADSRQFFTVIR